MWLYFKLNNLKKFTQYEKVHGTYNVVQEKHNKIDLTANPTPKRHLPPQTHTHFYMASLVRNRGNNSMSIVSVEQSSVGQYSLLVSGKFLVMVIKKLLY